MANMSARSLAVEKSVVEYGAIGGFARSDSSEKFNNDKLYYGPSWFSENIKDVY